MPYKSYQDSLAEAGSENIRLREDNEKLRREQLTERTEAGMAMAENLNELEKLRAERDRLIEAIRKSEADRATLNEIAGGQAQTIAEYARRLEMIWEWLYDRYDDRLQGEVRYRDDLVSDHPEAADWFDENGECK